MGPELRVIVIRGTPSDRAWQWITDVHVALRILIVRRAIETALVVAPAAVLEAMGRGVDTRDDGQGKANGASPIPIDGDEGGVR